MRIMTVIALTAILLTLSVGPVWAHQPFFEEKDITADTPWQVKDPTVSTAMYATLESPADVDYYTFEGRKGQSVLLEITIPQIAGQALFAPEMALLGPGLSAGRLPPSVAVPPNAGSLLIPALTGPAQVFTEPFSRTSYWERQSQRVTLPADGRYVVAVWHGEGEVGRYVFVIGDKERPGGDPAFMQKMRDYWTPAPQPAPVQETASGVEGRSCGSW